MSTFILGLTFFAVWPRLPCQHSLLTCKCFCDHSLGNVVKSPPSCTMVAKLFSLSVEEFLCYNQWWWMMYLWMPKGWKKEQEGKKDDEKWTGDCCSSHHHGNCVTDIRKFMQKACTLTWSQVWLANESTSISPYSQAARQPARQEPLHIHKSEGKFWLEKLPWKYFS